MERWFILHGWGGDSQENWFPWLKEQQEALGNEVFVPDFPNPDFPHYKEWRTHWEKDYVSQIEEDSVLVGHSLGGGFLLRWFSENEMPIGRLILVAPTPDDCDILEIKDFFTQPWSIEQIKRNAKTIEILGSENDPYIPFEKFKSLTQSLNAEFHLCPGRGHLNTEQLPEIFS